jgi:hypothetical protein
MTFLFLLLSGVCIIIGIIPLVFSSKRFDKIIWGFENSIGFRLKTSLGFGISAFLFFLGLLFSAGVFDSSYQWTKDNIFSSIVGSAFVGIIVAVLSFWSSITVSAFRGLIFAKLKILSKKKSLLQDHNPKDLK